MSTFAAPASVETVVRGLLGGIDVDGGPTDEQLDVLGAFATYVFVRPDLDPRALAPLGAEQTAAQLVDDAAARRHFHWLHMALEACRHPQSPGQVAAVEAYASALGVDGADLALYRALIRGGAVKAAADYKRFAMKMVPMRGERALADNPPPADEPDPQLTAMLESFSSLPDDSLGRAYLDFYERFQLTLPGVEATLLNSFFLAHDMTHVIAGIDTSAQGEVALGAFQMAMDDNDVNVSAMISSFIIHEAGFGTPTTIAEAQHDVLLRPGAIDLLGQEIARGAACSSDFALVDHIALAPLPLEEVRARYGVRPPVDPGDGHHFAW